MGIAADSIRRAWLGKNGMKIAAEWRVEEAWRLRSVILAKREEQEIYLEIDLFSWEAFIDCKDTCR
jgi:hypothetical protein